MLDEILLSANVRVGDFSLPTQILLIVPFGILFSFVGATLIGEIFKFHYNFFNIAGN